MIIHLFRIRFILIKSAVVNWESLPISNGPMLALLRNTVTANAATLTISNKINRQPYPLPGCPMLENIQDSLYKMSVWL